MASEGASAYQFCRARLLSLGGEIYRTIYAGRSWRRVSAEGEDVSRKGGYSFNQLLVDPNNPDRVFITGSNMIQSNDGSKTWAGFNSGGGRGIN